MLRAMLRQAARKQGILSLLNLEDTLPTYFAPSRLRDREAWALDPQDLRNNPLYGAAGKSCPTARYVLFPAAPEKPGREQRQFFAGQE